MKVLDCQYDQTLESKVNDLGVKGQCQIYLTGLMCFVIFVFNVAPTATVIWRLGHGLKSVKLGVEPATPGLQGKWFIHYTMAAPGFNVYVFELNIPPTSKVIWRWTTALSLV